MAPRNTTRSKTPQRGAGEKQRPQQRRERDAARKPLPYAIIKAAAEELAALLQERPADEWELDRAWIGLDRPNPEPGEDGRERIVVWMSREEATALQELIDGEAVDEDVLVRAEQNLREALRGGSGGDRGRGRENRR